MASRRSPTMRRRRLGAELRRLRKDTGRTIEDVASELAWSDSRVSRIETGQVSPSSRVVGQLLDLYGVTGDERDQLMHVVRVAQQKRWWQAYNDSPGVPVIGLEADATSIRIYEASVVHGLFQTASYARALMRTNRPVPPAEQIERWVELRMTRQQTLFGRPDTPALAVVIDEAVLRRPVGGADMMRQQLRHLAEVAARPAVTLQLLRFSAGEHPAMGYPFTVFGFPESLGPDVVYFEHRENDQFLEDDNEVQRYSGIFEELCGLALTADDSLALLVELAGAMEPSAVGG